MEPRFESATCTRPARGSGRHGRCAAEPREKKRRGRRRRPKVLTMASLSAAPAFTGAKSAMRHNEPNARLARSGIAPLRHRAVVARRSARAAAAGPNGTPNSWNPSPNTRTSPYTAPGGRDMPRERDLYEGTTGLDVLAVQKDLVAEGMLGRQHATGYVAIRDPRRVSRNHLPASLLPRPLPPPSPRAFPARPRAHLLART